MCRFKRYNGEARDDLENFLEIISALNPHETSAIIITIQEFITMPRKITLPQNSRKTESIFYFSSKTIALYFMEYFSSFSTRFFVS